MFRDKTQELKKGIRTGKFRYMLVKSVNDSVRSGTLESWIPYTLIEWRKAPKRYFEYFRMAKDEDRIALVKLERKIDRLWKQLAVLKRESFKRGDKMQESDFEAIYKALDKDMYKRYIVEKKQ